MKARVAHLSGRFDVPDPVFARGLENTIKTTRPCVLTLTETLGRRDTVKARLPAGWRAFQPHPGQSGECLIAYQTAVWAPVALCPQHLGVSVRGAKGGRRALWATTAVLQAVGTGVRPLFSVTHLPAHIEADWRRRTAQVQAWEAAVDGWADHALALAAEHQATDIVLLADWNLDLAQPWVREAIVARLRARGVPQARVIHPARGGSGSLGERHIDGVAGTAIGRALQVPQIRDGSDHDPVLHELNLRATPLRWRARRKDRSS